jgi:enolase
MFEYFSKKIAEAEHRLVAKERQKVIEEFTEIISSIKVADKTAQIAVGHGLNMANSFFYKRFHDIEGFKSIAKSEQIDYLKKLNATEKKIAKTDPEASLGFTLFKMWLVTIIQDDAETKQYFSEELAWVSKIGDLTGVEI